MVPQPATNPGRIPAARTARGAMASRRATDLTIDELLARMRIAHPRSAHGRYRRSATSVGHSWVAYGRRPVIAGVPAGADVEFWFRRPDQWRVEGADGLLMVT